MVNIFGAYKPVLRGIMSLAGVRPERVEVEPGTVLNFWVPRGTSEKSKTSNGRKNKQEKPKPTVVFLHGFAADGILTWQFQVLALARKYRVYVPDLLFFGGSITDKSERSTAFQAECVAKGLGKLGVEKCTLVGFSYGGIVGFKMAEMYSDLVESMVVAGAVTALTESINGALLERIGFESLPEYLLPDSVKGVKSLLRIAAYRRLRLPNFIFKDYLKAMATNRKEKVELLKALIINDEDFTQAHYPQWVHLLWGANDAIFNMEVAKDLERQLGGKTTLQCIEKAGHLAQLERPCVYNKHLKEILATLLEDGHKGP